MALALEGTPQHANSGSTNALALPAFTTTQAAQLFICSTENGGAITSISGGSLTWSNRVFANNSGSKLELWTAKATGAISAETYTVNYGSAGFATADVFAFSGNDTTPGWDGNASVPALDQTGVCDPLGFTTDNAIDVLIAGFRFGGTASPTQGSGWTKISGADFQLVEYLITSSSGVQSATVGTGVGDSNGSVADALKAAASTPATTPPVVGGSGSEDAYAEARRVYIDGKPYTVTSKSQYLGLLARSRRDKAKVSAESAIVVIQGQAKEALQAKQTAETASLLQALLARDAAHEKKKPKEPTLAIEGDIPIEVLMLIGQEI